jgi:hypothetical protein
VKDLLKGQKKMISQRKTMKRSLKDKIRGLLKNKSLIKRILRNNLQILKLLRLTRKKNPKLIKRTPNNGASVIRMRIGLNIENGLRNKRNSMKNAESKCRNRLKNSVKR